MRLKRKNINCQKLRNIINIILLAKETIAVFELQCGIFLFQIGGLQKSRKSVLLFPEWIMSQKLNLCVAAA